MSNDEKNYKRGLDCLENEHGRTFEFPDVYTTIDGYSARVLREWYTHIGVAPTRLQASTRYINYDNFDIICPPRIRNNQIQKNIFATTVSTIKACLKELERLGAPREDIAMLLPLGMASKMVDKRNLRNLIDMSRQRECNRAYWEYRELFSDYKNALRSYSEEWKYVVDKYFMPKCKYTGFCSEKHSCGLTQKKER